MPPPAPTPPAPPPAPILSARVPSPHVPPADLRRAVVALLIVQVLFGVWPVVGVLVLRHIPAQALVGLRIVLAGLFLVLIGRPWRSRLNRKEILACAGLALLGVAANQALFIEGLSRSTPINGAVLGALIPVYTTGVSVLLRRERATRKRLAGLAIALSGALFLVGAEQFDLGHERLVGNLLLVGNTFVYSLYLVLARPLLHRHGARVITAWMFAFAIAWILPWSLPAIAAVDWARVPPSAWLGLAWIVLTASVIAYLLNAWALRQVTASTVAAFVYLQPLVTGIAAGGVLHAKPGWQVLVAGALIFLGVALVSSQRDRVEGPPAPFAPRPDEA